MKYITDVKDAVIDGQSVVTLGKFDGLHRGHMLLFERLKSMKKEKGWQTVVFTFSMNLMNWKFGKDFKTIQDREERCRMLRRIGMDMLVECPFTDDIRNMEAERFVREILVGQLHAACIVCGEDFRFGHNRTGDYALLQKLSETYHFHLEMIPSVMEEKTRISSSRIREAIAQGNMEDANRMLGRPFTVEAVILDGQHLGRTIDMPTINQIPPVTKLLPPFGVYASVTEIDGIRYNGVTNIGRKPTVGEFAVGVETHLFHVNANFYGKAASVSLFHYLRPEKRFSSVDELKEQMHRDAERAEQMLLEDHFTSGCIE